MTQPLPALAASLLPHATTRPAAEAAGTVPEDGEHVWLDAARRGEPWALARFYEAYQDLAYTLCLRLPARPDDAEDATQAAFARAFAALPGFRGDSSAKTWLYRIAVNEATSILRKRSGVPVPLAHDVAASPDANGADRVAERLAVQAALSRLRPDHRTVLVLRFWEELSYDDIARVLALPLPVVKMRLSRAKKEFQRCYTASDAD